MAPNTSDRMDKNDRLDAVSHVRRHSVARLDPMRRESPGLPICQAVQFTVTDRSPFDKYAASLPGVASARQRNQSFFIESM